VFDGFSPNVEMSIVCGSFTIAVGGPACGFSGSVLAGWNGDQPTPCD
jgi:hypothetical protein